MKKQLFQVMSLAPVCVDFDDGRSISFQKGQAFEASSLQPQIARLLRNGAIRACLPFERPVIASNIGYSDAEQSLLRAREARKQRLKAEAEEKRASEIPSPLPKRRGGGSSSS